MRLMIAALVFVSATVSASAFAADQCGPTQYYMNRTDLPGDRILFEGVRINTDLSSYFFSVDSDSQALCKLLGAGKFLNQSTFATVHRKMVIRTNGEIDLYSGVSQDAIFALMCAK